MSKSSQKRIKAVAPQLKAEQVKAIIEAYTNTDPLGERPTSGQITGKQPMCSVEYGAGHNFVMFFGPYVKFTDNEADKSEENKMYFSFMCTRCGWAMEVCCNQNSLGACKQPVPGEINCCKR